MQRCTFNWENTHFLLGYFKMSFLPHYVRHFLFFYRGGDLSFKLVKIYSHTVKFYKYYTLFGLLYPFWCVLIVFAAGILLKNCLCICLYSVCMSVLDICPVCYVGFMVQSRAKCSVKSYVALCLSFIVVYIVF